MVLYYICTAPNEDNKPVPGDGKIYGKNNLIPKKDVEQGKDMEELAAAPRSKEDQVVDKTGMDEHIMPLPPLPPLLDPFERVVAKPNVPSVLSTKSNLGKLSSGRTFSIASLQQYTNSFSQDNLIGGGMLGTVYSAELPDGKVILICLYC